MNDQDNPYGGTGSAGNYQMSYQSDKPAQSRPEPAGSKPANEAQSPTHSPTLAAGGAGVADSGEVMDISTSQFVAEVIEASKSIPVVIDFWAPWCGPCKQLTPILEKVAKEFAGQAKLVKMNTEQYPEISGQMGIQSIPAVVVFVDGKPVDAFMGVKPESEVRQFFEKHAGPSAAIDVDLLLADARQMIADNDFTGAMNLLASLLQSVPDSPAAMALMGSIYLKSGDAERAQNLLQSIDEEHHGQPDVAGLKAELELAEQADEVGEIDSLIKAVKDKPADLQAKFDLSLAYNAGKKHEEAADLLLEIITKDRKWDDDGARKQLIKYFEAWGEKDDATKSARRKLSTALFS